MTQFYLITNISNATITGGIADVYGSTDVHLHVSAIVLMCDPRPVRREAPCRIRLFGTDASLPITEFAATTIEHEISPIPFPVPGAIQISYALRVDRWTLKLRTESEDGAPPEITAYPDGTVFDELWQDLRAKVAKHWAAPNMPLLEWVPAAFARTLFKIAKEA